MDYDLRFSVDDGCLSELHARAFAHPDDPPSIEVEPWSERLSRYSVAWVGAFHDDHLVGFVHACWDGGRHAFLLDTVVDPGHRHQGIATELVSRLTDAVAAAGCEWLHVDYEAHLDPFYRSCGFRGTGAGILRLRVASE